MAGDATLFAAPDMQATEHLVCLVVRRGDRAGFYDSDGVAFPMQRRGAPYGFARPGAEPPAERSAARRGAEVSRSRSTRGSLRQLTA
jgi:hypothetical protein